MKPSIIVPAVLLLVSCVNSDHGVKTARHAYSASASGSNSFANSFASGGGGGGIKVGVGSDFAGNPAFWWAGPNSPFQEAYDYFRRCSLKGNCGNVPGPFTGIPGSFPIPNNLPENGCNDQGCSFSGGFNINDKKSDTGDFGPIDISKNPYLNGEFQGISLSSCSGNSCPGGKPHSTVTTTNCKGSDCKTNTQHGTGIGDLNLQKNPFLNGEFGAAGGFGGSGAGGCAGVKGGCKGGSVPAGGAGCNGAPGCTEGSSSQQFAFHGQIGSGSASHVGGQVGGSSGCGSAGCGGSSGSYGGSQGGGYSGSTSFTGGVSGNGNQGIPPLIGGCAGTLGGCKPGQSPGGFGGSTSPAGSDNQGVPHLIGGCAGTLGGCKPGQTTGGFDGSTSPSGSGSQEVPPLIGGCAGTLGGCKPGQTTGGYSGSTTYTGNRVSGTTTGTFGGAGQGQPGQNIPTTYPGQTIGHGSTSGSFSGSGSTAGSYAGSGSTTGNLGGTGQGQTGYNGQGTTSGSYAGSGSTTGGIGGTGQGQPGYTGQGTTSGSYAGSGSSTGNIGGTGQGQPGHTGQGSTSGSSAGSGSTTGSIGGTGQGQPGYSGQGTTSGSYAGSGSTTGSIGGTGQGQPGYTGQGSTSGSYAGSGSTTGSIGGTGQGQPGYTGQGSTSGSYAGFGSTTGSIGGTGQGQPGHTGQGSTSGSYAGSGSSTGSFGSVGQGQSTYGQNIPHSGPTTGQGSNTGSFSGSGSTTGSFGGTGQGQSTYGQSTTGSLSGSGSTTGTFGGSGQGQSGHTEQGTTSGSYAGSGSTTGSFGGTGQGQPGYGQNVPNSQTGHTTGHFGSGSSTGSTSFTQSIPTTYPGQSGYDGQPDQVKPGYSGSTSQPGYTKLQTTSGGVSGTFGSSTSKFDHKTGTKTTTGSFGSSGSQPGKSDYPGASGQPGYSTGTTHGQAGSGSFSGSTSGSFGTSGYNSGAQNTHTTSGSGSGSTSGTYNQPGFTTGSQHTPSGGYTGSTGSFGSSGSFAGSSGFTGKTTPAGGDHSPVDGLQMKCYGEGLICVKKHLCSNGVINTDGDGLLHVRDGEHYCDLQTEICCKLPNKSGRPYKETPVDILNFPGGSNTFQTTNSHKSSSSGSSSTSSSFGSTSQYFGSQSTRPADLGNRFTPGPTAGGVQPGGVNNLPGQVPIGGYQPGQSIPFGGTDGQSPGVIQVIPDGQTGSKTPAPGLTRPGGLQQYGPGEAPALRTTPGFQQYGPGQAPGLRTTPGQGPTTPRFAVNVSPNGQGSTLKPSLFDATASGSDFTNELNFASTIKGPAYLPPGPSPSPSPSNFSPDLLPPDRYPNPTSPKPSTYYQSTPTPNNYYPTQKTTPAYLPPFSSTTKRPQSNNGYLPPDPDRVPDSDIIKISVIPPEKPDRDPQGTIGQETILRPTPRPTPRPSTEFQFNTTPYPGCAAALKCVEGDFCTAEGVISKTRIFLTPEQEINRVPRTECYDPESGIIGKCCRDPEYKDPWPSTQLGLFNPDQDGQGSNPGVNRQPGGNDGKYRPDTKQPGVKGGRPNGLRPGGTRPFNPYEPNQIGSPSNNPNSVIRPGGYLTDVPNIPFDSRLVNVPQQVDSKPPLEGRFDNKFPTSPVKNPETCGIRHPDAKPAGPGPIDAAFGEIPWQAMILRDTNRSLLCGGAIIRNDVILTAAHCVENLQADDVLVKGGEWKLGIDEEPKPFQINKVAAIVRHPGYRPENKLNDVALLILKDKFRLDRNVDTLCLPDPNEDVAKKFQNAKCITTGWGKTILQLNIVNSVMHILGVGIIQGSQCQQQLQQNNANLAYLYNTNCVCGAPIQSHADICDVDVGSALACEGPDGRYTLAGVYSWDTGCNPTAQVAGYSRVDTHWVQQTLQRPIKDLKTEESGFYQQLVKADCHCLPGKK